MSGEGYKAAFVPALEVLDRDGRAMLRDGDHVDGACATAPGVVYLDPSGS